MMLTARNNDNRDAGDFSQNPESIHLTAAERRGLTRLIDDEISREMVSGAWFSVLPDNAASRLVELGYVRPVTKNGWLFSHSGYELTESGRAVYRAQENAP